jgi:hypothetical protein
MSVNPVSEDLAYKHNRCIIFVYRFSPDEKKTTSFDFYSSSLVINLEKATVALPKGTRITQAIKEKYKLFD